MPGDPGTIGIFEMSDMIGINDASPDPLQIVKTQADRTLGKFVTITLQQWTLPIAGNQAMRLIEVNGMQFEVLSPLRRVAKILLDPFRNYLLPASFWRRLMKRSRSPLIAENLIRPGSWQSMRILHANATPVDLCDRLAVRYNPISMATRNRRKLVVAKLTEILKTFHGDSPVAMIGVGTGPGLHVQEAICRSNLDPTRVQAFLIDRDSDAFEYGRQCARDRGIENCISYVQGDAREIRRILPNISPQVVKIVGLLEYLTDEQVLDLFRALREVMAPGARILTHGMVDRYNTAPFNSRTFGLNHVYRRGSHVERLLRTAGFRDIETHEEPMRIYPILIGTNQG